MSPRGGPGSSVKDPGLYEHLRDEGASKQKAARVANAHARSGDKISRRGGESGSYEDWTVERLRKRARELGLPGRSHANKQELVRMLRRG